MSASRRLLNGYSAQLPINLAPLQICSIFAVEFNQRGSRGFVVSTHEAFWKRYQAMLPQHRHCYEIIRESEPCHLYFGERPPGLTFGDSTGTAGRDAISIPPVSLDSQQRTA